MLSLKNLARAVLVTGIAISAVAASNPALALMRSADSSTPSVAFAPGVSSELVLRSGDTARSDEVILSEFTPDQSLRSGAGNLRGRVVAYGGAGSTPALNNTLKAGVGCSIQCITSGVAYARDAGALLRVKTDTYATIRIEVWDDSHAWARESGPGVMKFDAHFDQLQANTTYHARAIATDSQGFQSEASGELTTLNRYVEVSFSTADVVDHAFADSNFAKFVWAQGEWLNQYEAFDLDLIDGEFLDWGENTIYLGEAPRYLDLAVQIVETDLSGPVVEGIRGPPTEPTHQFADPHAFSYATLVDNDLDDRPDDATSWTEHTIITFLQPPDSGGALPPGYGPFSFYVPITIIHVMYQ